MAALDPTVRRLVFDTVALRGPCLKMRPGAEGSDNFDCRKPVTKRTLYTP